MKVLFVCSGNGGVSPVITEQARTLAGHGIDISIFPIIGSGALGYLSTVGRLRRSIKDLRPDVIHAHYSFSAYLARISTGIPVICSLMGSDVKAPGMQKWLLSVFVRFFWAETIVKSKEMKTLLGVERVHVIPNGVDLDLCKPMDRSDCRKQLGWPDSKRIVLFASNPERAEKNYPLAKAAIEAIENPDVELRVVSGIDHHEIPVYLNAADLLILTSRWEGSPNIVKEAMACNIPIVSTKVGDVADLFTNTEGYILAESNPRSLSRNISLLLADGLSPNGRSRINQLGLDADSISGKLASFYKQHCQSLK